MKGIIKIDPAGFIEDFTRQALWTARLVREFDDKDLALRPAEGSLTTEEQIKQICAGNNFIVSILSDETPAHEAFKRDFPMGTTKNALRAIKKMIGEVREAAEKTAPDFWYGEIEPFGPQWRMTRAQTVYLMMDHEAHHRGQLTVYLRVTGKTPPMLYNPVDENEIFEGI